jgi:rod shape-determining protein MreC
MLKWHLDMFFNRIWQRHKKLIFVLFLFVLPLLPLVLSNVKIPRFHFYDYFSAFIVHPVSNGVLNASSGIETVWARYLNLVYAQRDNEVLKRSNDEYGAQLVSMAEYKRENARLATLLGLPEFSKFQSVAARIIGQDSSSEGFSYFINVGERDGLKARMPVVSDHGVVGTISNVFYRSALVVTLLDPSHDLDGLVVRSRARLIVEGKGAPLLGRLKYLDRSEDIRVGDEIITSGIDEVFPKGLLIGHVVKVSRPQVGVSQEAELRPAVDFGKLEEVLVLRTSDDLKNERVLPAEKKLTQVMVGPQPSVAPNKQLTAPSKSR